MRELSFSYAAEADPSGGGQPAPSSMGSAEIEVMRLTKRYRERVVVDDISFSVKGGEIVGFLGPNGAGKTTTMRMLAGFIPPNSGTAKVAGFDVREQSLQVRRRIGYLPEHPPLYPDLTVKEYLRYVGSLKGLSGKTLQEEIEHAVERTALQSVYERLIRNISKGYAQRTGLAQALLGNPKVLVLDEPTVGLDPRQIGEVRNLIKELSGSHTILLSTHILQEVVATCQRVIIIHSGKLVADDTIAALTATYSKGGQPRSLEEIFLELTSL
jgi:ABC-2 type transport system ATP-binding protein